MLWTRNASVGSNLDTTRVDNAANMHAYAHIHMNHTHPLQGIRK